MILLTKSRLDQMRHALYGPNVQATFYKVTPAAGEVEIGSIKSGFLINREQRSAGRDGQGCKMILATNAGIDRDDLSLGAAVAVTTNDQTTRYTIDELLPTQQVGAGYVLRLLPLTGATG